MTSSGAIKFEYIHYTDKLTVSRSDWLRLELSHSFIANPAGHLLAQAWQFIYADGIVSVVETAEKVYPKKWKDNSPDDSEGWRKGSSRQTINVRLVDKVGDGVLDYSGEHVCHAKRHPYIYRHDVRDHWQRRFFQGCQKLIQRDQFLKIKRFRNILAVRAERCEVIVRTVVIPSFEVLTQVAIPRRLI